MKLDEARVLIEPVAAAANVASRLRPVAAPAPPPPTVPKPRTRRKLAWLALQFPAWPMTAVLSGLTAEQRAQLQTPPFAILDLDRKRRVLVCNELARAQGVRIGHSLNAAIALCSELEVMSRSLERETALLESTARRCQRYTSTVSLEPPNQLLLEVRGSFRLFGGVAGLVEAVCADFAKRGIAVSVALTPTARSALWLSRGPRPVQVVLPRDLPTVLMRLPIQLLHWPAEITQRLARFGVTTLADLRRLPRAGLARRIGAQHLVELDAAFGRRPELRRSVMELPHYYDRVVLDAEIETTGLLEPLIAARLQILESFLMARTLALSELVLELMHRVHPRTAVRIGLALPTLGMSHLQTLIRERLSTLQLPEPIVELRLEAAHLVPAACCSRQLFQAGREGVESLPQRLARLVETLESRLGKQAVRALAVVADHRPEHAQAHSAIATSIVAASKRPHSIPEDLPQRPIWLLPEPASIRPTDFVILRGPESIESGWWDGQPCRREYFIAHDKQGALCWIFSCCRNPPDSNLPSLTPAQAGAQGDSRQRLSESPSGQIPQWYLHGLFG